MKFSTDSKQLHKALKPLMKIRAADEIRPALRCVQLTAEEQTLKLEALDGYCIVEKYLEAQVTESGTITVYPDQLVSVLQGCDGAAVFDTSLTELTVLTNQTRSVLPIGSALDYPRTIDLWPDAGRDATEIWINPQIMIKVLQALADKNRPVCLNVPLSKIKPIVISTADEPRARGLVLPVRMP